MKKITFILSLILILFIAHSSFVMAAQTPWWRSASPSAMATKEGQLTGSVTTVGTASITVNSTVVNVNSLTKIIRRFSGTSTLAEISVGDQVGVMGTWTDTSKTAVNARMVRDWSIQKRKGAFVGTIQTMMPTGFTFQSLNRGVQTVTVSALTKYTNRKEQAINFTDLATGQKVRVKGLWDNKLNTITEVFQIKDYSLPASSSANLRPNL
ncbi:hypothetical protein HY085_01175 [Candidatus Gottesmanbacteria bacterium]|nr:hypothetical protein [Candidatus Gottesmanbacteria bacterium]